ncbi:hypothetical protein DKJ32_19965 [Salmonella enterica]|nr:hypothetical protein CGA23_08105 [Salmonella enterica subsp. enterica]EAA2696280.1 hypothetical protein [Salmonella enterica]ATI90084.1 hypothetical protein CGA23_08235 [Salmonella enterica subsp. enterica]EAA2820057.1 hypothetical protein [Salmonella enterica]EAM3094089.1 hypothetical protein [Salmonella enterica]
MVEAREAQVVSQSAGRVFATGASSLGMGAGIAVAAEAIREHPDVFDSIRMCGEMVGNPQLCTGTSVFAAAYGLAKHTIDDSVSTGISSFGSNMMAAGQTTWGLLGQAAGVISVADLALKQGKKAVEYITSGIKQDDGTYLLTLPNGATVTSSVAPSPENPVAVYLPSDSVGFSAQKIQESIAPYNKQVKPVEIAPTYYNIDAPPPISQPLPDDVYRVSVKGTKYPYSADIRDTKGDAVLVSDNPVMIALYKSINGFSHPNVSYYEYSDENNLHIRMPRMFKVYSVSVKDFQYDNPGPYFGGFSPMVTVVLTVSTTTVTLENAWDLCKSEKVPAPGSTGDNPKTQWKNVCHPERAVYKTINDVKDVRDQIFFNTQFDTSNLPHVINGEVIDNIDFQPDEQLNPAALVNLINGLAGQAVVQDGYQGIPLDKPFTAAELTAAANAVGVKLDKGLLYSPVTVPQSWVNARPDTDIHVYPGTDTDIDTSVDLGEDPGIKTPELEKPPTGEEIIKPITELMPDIKNLSISSKDVQCPVWSFELWDNKYSIDSHCELLEKIRPLLKAVFLLIWGVISLRIILTA